MALFLCHGNVCRSPFAAEYFAKAIRRVGAEEFAASSAGFIGPDRPAPPEAQDAALRFDVDLGAHRSRLVTRSDIDRSNIIVVMSAEQERAIRSTYDPQDSIVIVLGDLDPLPIRKRTVLDPWKGDPSAFQESYGRIVRCTDALVQLLTVGRIPKPGSTR